MVLVLQAYMQVPWLCLHVLQLQACSSGVLMLQRLWSRHRSCLAVDHVPFSVAVNGDHLAVDHVSCISRCQW